MTNVDIMKHVTAVVDTQALLAAGIQTAGSVVLGTGAVAPTAASAAGSQQNELSDSEADARVLAALLQVRAAVFSFIFICCGGRSEASSFYVQPAGGKILYVECHLHCALALLVIQGLDSGTAAADCTAQPKITHQATSKCCCCPYFVFRAGAGRCDELPAASSATHRGAHSRTRQQQHGTQVPTRPLTALGWWRCSSACCWRCSKAPRVVWQGAASH
jgi:hypothetical protein